MCSVSLQGLSPYNEIHGHGKVCAGIVHGGSELDIMCLVTPTHTGTVQYKYFASSCVLRYKDTVLCFTAMSHLLFPIGTGSCIPLRRGTVKFTQCRRADREWIPDSGTNVSSYSYLVDMKYDQVRTTTGRLFEEKESEKIPSTTGSTTLPYSRLDLG